MFTPCIEQARSARDQCSGWIRQLAINGVTRPRQYTNSPSSSTHATSAVVGTRTPPISRWRPNRPIHRVSKTDLVDHLLGSDEAVRFWHSYQPPTQIQKLERLEVLIDVRILRHVTDAHG